VHLELAHVGDRRGIAKLAQEIIAPARARGCPTIWLGGISLGVFSPWTMQPHRQVSGTDFVCCALPREPTADHGDLERAQCCRLATGPLRNPTKNAEYGASCRRGSAETRSARCARSTWASSRRSLRACARPPGADVAPRRRARGAGRSRLADLDSLGAISGFEICLNKSVQTSRWKPTPLLAGSAAVHLGAVAATLRAAALALRALCVVLNHLLLSAAGLWPRSRWLGPNWTSLRRRAASAAKWPSRSMTGPDPEVTPQFSPCSSAMARAPRFFCVGERILRYPDLAQEISRRGHAIENHTQRHRHDFSLLGQRVWKGRSSARRRASRGSQARPALLSRAGRLRNPFLEPVLCRLHLRLTSWTRRGFDTVNRSPAMSIAVEQRLAGRRYLAFARWQRGARAERSSGDRGGAAAVARHPAEPAPQPVTLRAALAS